MIETFTAEDRVLVRYLLGEMDEAEILELEEEMLLNEELAGRAEVVEMNLIDAYVRGELGDEEGRTFKEKFLADPENAEKVDRARMFHESLRRLHGGEEVAAPHAAPERERLPWFAALFQRPLVALSFVLAVALLAGVLYLALRQPGRGAEEVVKTGDGPSAPANVNAPAEANVNLQPVAPSKKSAPAFNAPAAGQTPPPAKPPDEERRSSRLELARNDPRASVRSVALFRRGERGGERSADDALHIALDAATTTLRLSYELLDDVRESETYRVAIMNKYREGVELRPGAREVAVRPVKGRGGRGRFVIIDVPAAAFKDGELYSFEIDDPNTAAKTFTVRRAKSSK